MIAVCYILDVTTDDWCRYAENLLCFWIELEETLGSLFVAFIIVLQVTHDRLTGNELLLLLFVENLQVKLIELWIEEYINTSFWCADKSASLYLFTVFCDDSDR